MSIEHLFYRVYREPKYTKNEQILLLFIFYFPIPCATIIYERFILRISAQLSELWRYCEQNHLFLFIGRFGHALAAEGNESPHKDISALTDILYIERTKNGGLLGDAIIFNRKDTSREFDHQLKQKGSLLAKGRLLGIQFLELFR